MVVALQKGEDGIMVTRQKKNLMNEFLRDHHRLTRILSDVIRHLEGGDVSSARSLAQELNRIAGPHIAFEESVLYPAVRLAVGESFERKLLAEHDNARMGLVHLISAEPIRLAKPEFREKIVTALRSGMKHAESCGTLVSHLEQLSETQQQQALTKLNELKKAGKCWSEL